jgi:predicted Rossmann-fold nucleotide-binding protein
LPILLLGKEYWNRVINFEAMVEDGVIEDKDLTLFRFVDSAQEALQVIKKYYDF